MTRRHNKKVPTLFLLALAVLFLAAVTGCERKVEGTVETADSVSDQCFNCHNGQMDAMQGEWANSIHGSGSNVDYTSRPAPNDCQRCHNQEGFITWINTGTIPADAGNAKAIGCFACHNPHENGDLRLRVEAPVTMPSGEVFNVGRANLCANCHQARGPIPVITDNFVIASSRFGPHHGPQGDLLIGTVGYEATPGFVAGSTLHKDIITNGCIGCHMNYANSHEGYDVGGHSWNMRDEATPPNSLAADCKSSGCHDAGALAFTNPTSTSEPFNYKLTTGAVDWDDDGVVEGYQSEMEGMLDSLAILLDLQNIYNPATGLAVTGTYADGDLVGAYWNFVTVEEDRSLGIHNWEYTSKLIQASRDYVATLPIP